MKNLFARLRRAWVCLSVCSAVGLSLAPSSSIADTVIPTGPFCSDCVLTNITFYSVADFDAWASYVSNSLDSAMAIFGEYQYRVTRILVYCGTITNACDTILYNLDYIQASDEQSYKQAINTAVNDIRTAVLGSWNTGIIYQINSLRDDMELSELDMREAMSTVSAGLPRYRAEVATACSASPSGGGSGSTGCCCPDYTEYIDEIEDYLDEVAVCVSNIEATVSTISGQIEQLRTILVGFRLDANSWKHLWEDQSEYLYYLVCMALNALDACDSLLGSNNNMDPESAGGRTGAYLAYFLNSQYNKNYIITNMLTRLATRDWWNWQGHLHDSPDYQDFTDFVSVGIQGLTGLVMPYDDADAWPIVNAWRDYYYSRNVHPTNEISNPLWVAFTNRVRLSDDIVNISVSSYSGDSIAQLTAMLTNIVLNVVQVTNDINVTAEAEVDVAVDILDEKVDETSDPEQESDTIRTNRVDLSSISRVMRSTVSSYKSIFTTILQEEPPERIMITSGWHVGYEGLDFEIESIYWEPDGVENHWLTVIRKIFRAVWACVFLVVIYAACGFDLFVVGVCAYMCYGVLTGRTDVAVKGLKSCFDVLCRMLGFHAGK